MKKLRIDCSDSPWVSCSGKSVTIAKFQATIKDEFGTKVLILNENQMDKLVNAYLLMKKSKEIGIIPTEDDDVPEAYGLFADKGAGHG